jgi:hypothetical protein
VDEANWLAANDIGALWHYLKAAKRKPGARKLRLFACACCRRGWAAFREEAAREAVEVAERAADRRASRKVLEVISSAARSDAFRGARFETLGLGRLRPHYPEYLAEQACGAAAEAAAPKSYAWINAWRAATNAAAAVARLTGSMLKPAYHDALAAENRAQAFLFRHLVGNPFRPYPAPAAWPQTVVQLAQALYDGQDCRLPLSDALKETGHPDLASHFRNDEWHPKGCWAMDGILGKG